MPCRSMCCFCDAWTERQEQPKCKTTTRSPQRKTRICFREGTHSRLYERLGCHAGAGRRALRGVGAERRAVSVVGDWNGWSGDADPLSRPRRHRHLDGCVRPCAARAGLQVPHRSRHGGYRVDKADPFAFCAEAPPAHRVASSGRSTTSGTTPSGWRTRARAQRARRADVDLRGAPGLVAARSRTTPNRSLSYRELAHAAGRVRRRAWASRTSSCCRSREHPFYGSWGYQTTGYFAPTSRYGTPQDFMYLVDHLHQHGIGVILDWVPAHFPSDEHGLGYFDGTHLYEHADPRQGYHPDWNSCIFNYGRNEVRSFLLSQRAVLARRVPHRRPARRRRRLDALPRLLAASDGEWIPNQLRRPREPRGDRLPARVQRATSTATIPDVQTIAEESTAWPRVSRPTYVGGLGFGLKWNMGWMHDTLRLLRSTTRSTASTTTTS